MVNNISQVSSVVMGLTYDAGDYEFESCQYLC